MAPTNLYVIADCQMPTLRLGVGERVDAQHRVARS